MSHADRRAAAAIALAVGGCMRIYPDPDLPDVKVEWFTESDCVADTDRVVVSLSTGDPSTEVDTVTVPCADASVRLVDVARERYTVTTEIVDPTGAVLGQTEQDIDLRDGINERVSAYFNRSFGVFVQGRWTFDPGVSCETLSSTQVLLAFSQGGEPPAYLLSEPCEIGFVLDMVDLFGPWTVSVRALARDAVVAVSPASATFTFIPGQLIEFGTLVLSPCGDACPALGE